MIYAPYEREILYVRDMGKMKNVMPFYFYLPERRNWILPSIRVTGWFGVHNFTFMSLEKMHVSMKISAQLSIYVDFKITLRLRFYLFK